MNQRAEIYALIADIRGRLEELEGIVRALPGTVVPSPASFDEPGVESLTPAAYTAFRQSGLEEPVTVTAFNRHLPFFQMGAADDTLPVELESFELSSLHKVGVEPAYGLRVAPSGPQQSWLTYEMIVDPQSLPEYEWTEWILKISAEEPCELLAQFVASGQGFSEKIPHSRVHVSEYASFIHIRLPGATLRSALAGRVPTQLRMLMGTGGKVIPVRIYSFSIFGKR